MILAHMMAIDEEALICDFAETYHIYNYQSLPVHLAAIFACGLRDTSRIQQKLNDINIGMEGLLMAGVLDRLSMILWGMTEEGKKGINRPRSVTGIILGKTDAGEIETFDTIEDYEKRQCYLKGVEYGE